MKRLNYKILFVMGLLCMISFYSCKSSSTEPGPPPDTREFYPVTNGSWYKYSMTETDSLGMVKIAFRTSHINGTSSINGTSYQIQLDSFFYSGSTEVSNTYFRKNISTSAATVYFFVDTTGIYTSIPSEYLPYLTIDQEILAFSFPYSDGREWLGFKMNINYQGVLNFNPVEMRATYNGTEDVILQLSAGTVTRTALKIKIELSVKSDPTQIGQIISANVWLVENIGIAKWEGNATIINVFTGGGIDFDDSTSVITQSLIDYKIQP